MAVDEEDLLALQFQVAIEGTGQHIHWGNEDAVGLRKLGDGRAEFDFHDRIWMAAGISGRAGRGAKVRGLDFKLVLLYKGPRNL